MTITGQDMEDYSPFKVSEVVASPGTINTETFLKYAMLAKKKLDRDDPGLEPEEYDHAQALLVAHYIAARNGTLEKTTEWIDNYKYDKRAGTSSFLVQYETLIKEAQEYLGEKPTQLIAHADGNLGSLKLDQAALPRLFDPGEVDEEAEEP